MKEHILGYKNVHEIFFVVNGHMINLFKGTYFNRVEVKKKKMLMKEYFHQRNLFLEFMHILKS